MKFLAFIGRTAPFVFAVFVPVFLALVLFNVWFLKPADKFSTELIPVEIPKDASVEQVADILASRNLVRSRFATRILLNRIQKKQETPLTIVEGEYEISPALTPSEVLSHVLEGKTIKRTFRIKEKDTYFDIAAAIERSGLFPKETMLQVMRRRDLLIKLRLNAGIPEGYFLPGEFTFSKPITPEAVFETIIKKSQEDFNASFPTRQNRLEKLYLDTYQLLILASIIEKEGSTTEMKKLISSVYYNRLMLQMPFESEEVLAYALEKGVNEVSLQDRTVAGPYNTFLRWGLPATPICTPGKDSISASLFPTRSEYLYFLPNPGTTADFSYTLDEHRQKQRTRR